jgi:replicative DNA helicase
MSKKLFSLHVEQSLHEKLKEFAKQNNTSVAAIYNKATKNLIEKQNDNNVESYHNFFNENIERAILSSILFEPQMIENLSTKIQSDDFYDPFHQEVYNAYIYLNKRVMPIDEEFTKKILMQKKKWDEVRFLNILAANPISNTSEYIDLLLEYSIKRKLNLFLLRSRNELIENYDSPFVFKDKLMGSLENIEDNRKAIVKPTSILDIEEEEIHFYIKDWLPIPQNAITIIGGSGGAAKSALVLQALMRISIENPKLKMFAWLSEDLKGYSKQRFNQFKEVFFRNENLNNFVNLDIAGSDNIPFFLLNVTSKGIDINEKFYRFKNDMKQYDIIVLDPLIGFFGGEENSNTHARAFMNALNEWVSKENKTLILIHHSKKPGNESNDDSKIRGAGAIVDASRLSYEVKSISLKNYVDDYRFFTGSRYNAFAPKISENDTSSDNYHLAMDAIMTHRRILIAKDNLGVRMFMKNDCNKSNMFYRKAWGELSNFSIDVESGSKLSESDMHFLTSDVEVVIFDEDM